MGNPFLEESQNLLVLDSEDIMGVSDEDTVRMKESLDTEQYKTFVVSTRLLWKNGWNHERSQSQTPYPKTSSLSSDAYQRKHSYSRSSKLRH